MPVEISKWLCKFHCGLKAQSKPEHVLAHEKNCWKNPANKTCKTCSNEIYKKDGDEYRDWCIRDCELRGISEMLDRVHDILKGDNKMHIRPIQHCKYHNVKHANVDDVLQYSLDVERAIKINDSGFYMGIKWPI